MRAAAGTNVAVVLLAVAACSSPDNQPTSDSAPNGPPLTYVALGDSWPSGVHCGGFRTFVDLYADALEEKTKSVRFVNLTQTSLPDGTGQTARSLLKDVKSAGDVRDALKKADIVVIATGPNGLEGLPERFVDKKCGGKDNLECIHRFGDDLQSDFDAMLTGITHIRDGRPTAIRLVNAGDALSYDSEFTSAYRGFAPKATTVFFNELTKATCAAAEKHNAKCVDVRPLINGPKLNKLVLDENDPKAHQAIADLLMDTGLGELSK